MELLTLWLQIYLDKSSSLLETFSNFCISADDIFVTFSITIYKRFSVSPVFNSIPHFLCIITGIIIKVNFYKMVYYREFWFSIICFSKSFFYPLTTQVSSRSHIFFKKAPNFWYQSLYHYLYCATNCPQIWQLKKTNIYYLTVSMGQETRITLD